MSATPKKSTEAEDVLEFLNSLPEGDKKAGKSTDGGADDGDIMEFLDELEATDKKKKNVETVKKEDKKTPTPETKTGEKEVVVEEKKDAVEEADEEEEVDNMPDPIASISNWWSSSGSATVSSLWNNARDEATKLSQKAQEEATKFTTQAKLDEQIKKLQSLQLDDETKQRILSAGDDMDPSKALGFLTKNITSVFNSIMATDEVLKISVTHDLENYYVESLISKSFKQVMKQVQGGIAIELITNTAKDHNKRNLNIFEGKAIDAEKLAFANLETCINDFNKATHTDGDEEIRSSNLFISILPIQPFAKDSDSDSETIVIDTTTSTSFHFIIILKDITNDITIITKSQSFPLKWATWLDGSVDTGEEQSSDDEGVDPAEWVKQWVYEGLGLSFGVLAQSYVVKRMGYDKK